MEMHRKRTICRISEPSLGLSMSFKTFGKEKDSKTPQIPDIPTKLLMNIFYQNLCIALYVYNQLC